MDYGRPTEPRDALAPSSAEACQARADPTVRERLATVTVSLPGLASAAGALPTPIPSRSTDQPLVHVLHPRPPPNCPLSSKFGRSRSLSSVRNPRGCAQDPAVVEPYRGGRGGASCSGARSEAAARRGFQLCFPCHPGWWAWAPQKRASGDGWPSGTKAGSVQSVTVPSSDGEEK